MIRFVGIHANTFRHRNNAARRKIFYVFDDFHV